MTSFTWVIVSYGTAVDAVKLARDVLLDEPDSRIIIGCNRTGDARSAVAAVGDETRIEIHDAAHNPGYIGLLGELWATLDPRHSVVLSNSDLGITPGFHEAIRCAQGAFPEAMQLGPAIQFEGKDQNPHLFGPPSNRRRQFLRWLTYVPQAMNLVRLISDHRAKRPSVSHFHAGEQMYAAHGSCIVLTPVFRDSGCSVEYPLFLFGEELWLAREIDRAGGTVRYVPEAVAHHHGHASTGVVRRGAIARAQVESIRYWASQSM